MALAMLLRVRLVWWSLQCESNSAVRQSALRDDLLTPFRLWFGLRCVVTCMYGAYMYGRDSVNAKDAKVGFEDDV